MSLAGAGFNTKGVWFSAQITAMRSIVSNGISSCTNTAPALLILAACSSIMAGNTQAFAPLAMPIQFSASAFTKIHAEPVPIPSITLTSGIGI